MDLNNLNSFLTVVKFMNFTKAANFLHVSQSTLSRQVSALEKELKAKLLIRDSHNLRLTPAGTALVERGNALNREASELSEYISRIAIGKVGSLSIALPTMSCDPLFRSCSYFQKKFPSVLVSLQITQMEDIFGLVLNGIVDIGCTFSYSLPLELEKFNVISVQENSFGVVARTGHALMQKYKTKIPITALKNESVFGLSNVSMARDFLASNINNAKQLDYLELIFPQAQHQNISSSSMIVQTLAGLGITFLPYSLFALYNQYLSFRELAELDTRHQILMISRKDNINPNLELFFEIFKRLHAAERDTSPKPL